MFVDSHCHLAGSEFVADLDSVIDRARQAALGAALVVLAADDEAELRQAGDVARRWDAVRFAIGVHPHNAGRYAADPTAAAAVVDRMLEAQPLARAVGETGLDYHYDFAPRELQQEVFRGQIRLAVRRRLPLVIHTREADDDTLRLLSEERAGDIDVVFHCFTGTREMARRVLDLGCHLSLSGIVTFPRALELHEVARMVPRDRLLIETDSPFLAPVPHRGRRNEPAYVVRVAEAVAGLQGTTVDEIAASTRAGYQRVFKP